MGKKADILSNINTKLADASTITAQEHREALATDTESILEAIYGSPLEDNVTVLPEVQNVVTKIGSDIIFKIFTQKVGRRVTMNGVLSNTTTNYLSLQNVFTITLSEYLQDTETYYCVGIGNNGYNYDLRLQNDIFSVNTILAPGISVTFNLTYNTLA